jgi:hypothetical protein
VLRRFGLLAQATMVVVVFALLPQTPVAFGSWYGGRELAGVGLIAAVAACGAIPLGVDANPSRHLWPVCARTCATGKQRRIGSRVLCSRFIPGFVLPSPGLD